MFELKGKYTNAVVMADQVEPECVSQIITMINHSAFTNPVVIMPDTHSGKGSVIGFTMRMGEKLIPNVVGVDIGCGMLSANFGKIEIDHQKLDNYIRSMIPFGFNIHERGIYHMKDQFKWNNRFDHDWFKERCKKMNLDESYIINSIGTLGGGNHFIEVGRSVNTEDIWITIHSGSRNFGKKVCDYWQKKAANKLNQRRYDSYKERLTELKKEISKQELESRITDLKKEFGIGDKINGLEFLTEEDVIGYLNDMHFAQLYAQENRMVMLKEITKFFGLKEIQDLIGTIHNFIDPDDSIIRKGAIRSYVTERMIIPFNPKDGLLICEGKSKPDWNFSAPHGAGRIMSRSRAKREISDEMAEKAMEGIFSTAKPKDESPLVYKDPEMIEKLIEPTARVIDRVIPIHNMKAGEGED